MSVSNAAQAQSHDFSQNQFWQSSGARLTLAISFGIEREDSKADPRLAFSVRQYQPQYNFDNSWVLKSQSTLMKLGYAENVLAMSLGQAREFTLNFETLYFTDQESANLSDEAKIAGKIALAAGVITVVVIGAKVILLVANDGNYGNSDCDELSARIYQKKPAEMAGFFFD